MTCQYYSYSNLFPHSSAETMFPRLSEEVPGMRKNYSVGGANLVLYPRLGSPAFFGDRNGLYPSCTNRIQFVHWWKYRIISLFYLFSFLNQILFFKSYYRTWKFQVGIVRRKIEEGKTGNPPLFEEMVCNWTLYVWIE